MLVRERSTATIPFPPLVLTFLCSFIWFFYGLYIINVQIMIPNAFGKNIKPSSRFCCVFFFALTFTYTFRFLGVVFGTIQLSLYAWARSHERNAARRVDNDWTAPSGAAEDGEDDRNVVIPPTSNSFYMSRMDTDADISQNSMVVR